MSHTLQNAMTEYIKFLQEKSESTKPQQQDLKTYLIQLTNEFVTNHFDLNEKESDCYIHINKSCKECRFPHQCITCFECKQGVFQDKYGKNYCRLCGYPESHYSCSKCKEGVCKNCWFYEVLEN